MSDDPLDGLTVVDCARFPAGAFCATVLRWLGARVVRVVPREGDGPDAFEDGAVHERLETVLHEGKEVHVEAAPSAQSLAPLLRSADVLVSDATAGSLEAAGLGPEALEAAHPRLVLASITGYGLAGPHREWPASELTTYHAGGEGYTLPGEPVHSLFPDREPVRGGRGLADYDAGVCGAIGAVAALVARERTGRGDLVEVSAQEVELGLNRTTVSRSLYDGLDADRAYRGYDYAGTLRCRDGHMCIRPVEDRQWASFARAIGRHDLVEDARFATRAARFTNELALTRELEAWTGDRSREEVRAAMLECGCPGGPFLEPADVLTEPANREREVFLARAGGSWPHRLFKSRPSPAGIAPSLREDDRAPAPGLPLRGMRVLDFTWVAAGPYATELLAFMGADVIKIESRERPDLFRRRQDAVPDLDSSIRFVDLNQGKRSLCVDLKSADGVRTVERLAARSDALVANFRPGVRDRLGIGDEALRAGNPGLVSVSISGFGQDGSERMRPGYASVFNAESGLGAMTGYPDAPPSDIRDSNDLRIGMAACLATVTGLLRLARTGEVRDFDVAGREVLIALQSDVFLEASRGGRPTREGNGLGRHCPYGCYAAPAGHWVAVSVRTRPEWRALVDVIDAPDLRDPALDEIDVRWAARDRIERALVAWLAGRPASRSVELLAAAGVPAAVSSSASVLREDPHLEARGFFRTVDYPKLGAVTFLGPPLRFGRPGSHAEPLAPPPAIDAHASEIRARLLGAEPLTASAAGYDAPSAERNR